MSLRVGIIGTGAIADLHARAYRSIGYTITVCTDVRRDAGQKFADATGATFVESAEDVCRHPQVDYVDLCTLPGYRLDPIRWAAAAGKAIQVQKPIATSVAIAHEMVDITRRAGVVLGVVSQHRFDASSQFLIDAIHGGRLGRLIQCDAYVKWYRSAEYYSRPVKGSWDGEGGGALINQAIHQVDLLRWFAGPVTQVFGSWQLGAVHAIQSEDVVTAVLKYANGATGTIQAATALWPGYPERVELHGTKGSAIVTGDRLTTWDVQDDHGAPAPLSSNVASGASDPMAISLEPFERQFLDFGRAVRAGTRPLIAGEDGVHALELVDAIYRSCRANAPIALS